MLNTTHFGTTEEELILKQKTGKRCQEWREDEGQDGRSNERG